MIKAILFDVDGVIINTGFFTKRLEEDYGISIEKTMPFFKGRFQECQLGRADLKEELKHLIKEWGWDKSVDELLKYWFEDSKNNVNENLLNDIGSFRQRGIKCFLGTNQEKYRSKYLKNNIGLAEALDGFFVSADIGYRKPTKEFFEYVSNKLPEIQKSEVLFWDSDDDIVKAAKEYGFSSEPYINYEDFKTKMSGYLN